MPDASGYDWRTGPHRPYQPGDRVYIVDVTHVWEATFVEFDGDNAVVVTPGGERVNVARGDLRRA